MHPGICLCLFIISSMSKPLKQIKCARTIFNVVHQKRVLENRKIFIYGSQKNDCNTFKVFCKDWSVTVRENRSVMKCSTFMRVDLGFFVLMCTCSASLALAKFCTYMSVVYIVYLEEPVKM